MALAAELGVADYPAPAGGCLLTEPGFSQRLRDLLTHDPGAGVAQVELLKHGRHLRLSPRAKLVVGRDQAENEILEAMLPPGGLKLWVDDLPGPLGIYLGPAEGGELDLAAGLVAGYGKAVAQPRAQVKLSDGRRLAVAPLPRQRAQGMLL